jgi:hypothetical protein
MTEVPEAEVAEHEVAIETEAHVSSPEGWFSQFLQILRVIINCGDFHVGCASVHNDGGAELTFIKWLEGSQCLSS